MNRTMRKVKLLFAGLLLAFGMSFGSPMTPADAGAATPSCACCCCGSGSCQLNQLAADDRRKKDNKRKKKGTCSEQGP